MLRYNRRLKPWVIKFILFILIAVALFLLIDAAVRPIIRSIALTQAQSLAQQMIGDSTPTDLLESGSFVTIEKDNSGNIVSVTTDAMRMNSVKSAVSSGITQRLNNLTGKDLAIPLGTLTRLSLLNGRGPKIRAVVGITGNSQTAFVSEFSAAGVNQTCHRVLMKTTVNLTIVFATYTLETSYTSTILVAETILVGSVPEVYAGITQK